MAVTFTFNGTTIASSAGTQAGYVDSASQSDVFVITFSDGTRIAISGYNDQEPIRDFVVGIPTPSGGTDTVNLDLYFVGGNATFQVYDYGFGFLGTQLYSYSSGGLSLPVVRFRFDPATNQLMIDTGISTTAGTALDLASSINTDGTVSSFSGSTAYTSTICFLAGTRILTDRGPVAVESLRPGDRVATRFGGLRPVRWIGTQTLLALGATGMIAPVRIRAGALGEHQPAHDLQVSPGHAVLLCERLVCAYLLINGTTIVQPPHTGPIRYVHIDLGTHDCVLAEGAWAETYYEHLNRDGFDNAGEFHARFPNHQPAIQPTCLPYVNQPDDPALPSLRTLLAAAPAGPHLHAGDAVILPDPDAAPGSWRFTVPAGAGPLRLRSPAASPAACFGLPDDRRLGLRLRAITVERDGTTATIELASPALADGWHAPEHEQETTWRWTNGDAVLDLPSDLAGAVPGDGPAILTLHGYALHPPARAAA